MCVNKITHNSYNPIFGSEVRYNYNTLKGQKFHK